MTPHHAESNANTFLGDLLRPMLGRDDPLAQNSRTIVGHPGWQPDLLITAVGRSPVVVEAEYPPAAKVEQEAKDRLGCKVTNQTLSIEAAIALRYPPGVDTAPDLRAAVKDARFSYCVFSVEGHSETPEQKVKKTARFPESGWLEGGLTDLADLIRLVSLPQLPVNDATDAMQKGIDRVVSILDEREKDRPALSQQIAKLLGMDNVPQTRRMAGAILVNATVFHERIAGSRNDIKVLSQVCGPEVSNPKAETLKAWQAILKIDYHPIFDIARRILDLLPTRSAAAILHTLEYTAGEVESGGVENSHDLTGRVFQRLIADRKYLATFYTRPASAALLARLAVAKMPAVNWADDAAIGKLRIGDFACGTGALLSAVYEQIAARHERAGGNLERLHPAMMQNVLYGCDVLPSAVHITGSTLSGAQPHVIYRQSRLYTMPYGRLSDGSVAIGSLDFLKSDAQLTLSNFSDPATRTGSTGDAAAGQAIAEIKDATFDLIIMNPPFTRATNHEGAHADVVNPAFAAFAASKADMNAMGRRMTALGKGISGYHGNAGMASAFAALADKKLKPGGILALVLPLSAAAGSSWQGFRQMLAAGYDSLTVLSIAANDKDMSFSSDTGMAECLVVARKLRDGETPAESARFTSLRRRPPGFAAAAEVAKGILSAAEIRDVAGGPYGGTPLFAGDELVGEMLTAPIQSDGRIWGSVRISDPSVAQVAHSLTLSELWLPRGQKLKLPVLPLGQIGSLGLVSRDIDGPQPRGAFDRAAFSPTATYPALWNHDADQESKIVCQPDSSLRVRLGMEQKAETTWQVASRVHLNTEFTFGSQPLAVAFTENDSMGGRVWPNVKFSDARFDYAFSLWGNSTLGLVSYWWHSTRQQSSKATVSVRTAESLPVLDFRALTDAQLTTAQEIFDEFRDKELQPAYLADADPNRALLDRRVICDLLNFDATVYQGVRRLAEKWCAEPSVHGGKARPRDARLIA